MSMILKIRKKNLDKEMAAIRKRIRYEAEQECQRISDLRRYQRGKIVFTLTLHKRVFLHHHRKGISIVSSRWLSKLDKLFEGFSFYQVYPEIRIQCQRGKLISLEELK